MSDFKPLFPEDSERTEQFRRLIIRKTLQLVRENPKLEDDQVIDLAEIEAKRICDLCIESSYDEDPDSRISQYFMDERVGQRRNHVGRFFVFALEGYLNEPIIKRAIYRVLASSTEELMGKKTFNSYSQKITEILRAGSKEGLSYNKIMEQKPSKAVTHEIINLYWNELQNNPSYSKQLKNQIDSALTRYQAQKPAEAFDIEAFTEEVYDYFITALKKNLDPNNL